MLRVSNTCGDPGGFTSVDWTDSCRGFVVAYDDFISGFSIDVSAGSLDGAFVMSGT